MYPDELFAILDVAAVRAEFGTPVRIYPFGDAPPKPVVPYAAHQLVTASPLNCLDEPPPMDDERVQFTVWGDDLTTVSAATKALRRQLEQSGYINNYSDAGRDPTTMRYGIILDWSRLEPWPTP